MNEEQNYGDNWMTQFWVLQLPNSSQTGQTVLDYLCVKPYDESIFSDLYDSPVHMSYLDPPCYFTAIAMYIKKRISFLHYLLCYGAGPSYIQLLYRAHFGTWIQQLGLLGCIMENFWNHQNSAKYAIFWSGYFNDFIAKK